MRNLSAEAKVGIMTLTGLALLFYMVVYLGGMSFGEDGYPVNAAFKQVNGLTTGNVVRYAGVMVGKVDGVDVTPDGVNVILRINKAVKLPKGSHFAIGTDGLMGEKFIDVVPPTTYNGFIGANDTVQGETPKGFDKFMTAADAVLTKLDTLLNSFNDVFGEKNVKEALKVSILNAKDITDNLNTLSATLARLAVNNEQDIQLMVKNLQAMSNSLNSVATRVDKMMTGIDNNGETVKDLKETLQNIKVTSRRIQNMAQALEGVVTDPKTISNLKETLQNARDVSVKANKMLTSIDNIKTEASVEVLSPLDKDKDYRSNARVRISTSPQDFTIIGLTNIGEDNKFTLHVGKTNGVMSYRGGVTEGKAGLGIDGKINKDFKLSVDVYDPNDVKVQLRTEFRLAPDTYIIGENRSINQDRQNNTYIGIKRAF